MIDIDNKKLGKVFWKNNQPIEANEFIKDLTPC